jgi:Ca2+-binding RTX toxin-like protein
MCRSALLATILLAMAPAAAQAADASITGSTLSFVAAPGEANDLTVSLSAGTYTLVDAGAPVTAGAGCVQVGPAEVTCLNTGVTALVLDGRDVGDSIAVGAGTAPATLTGAGGDDVLTGGSGADTLNGGADADHLDGAGANDVLNGDSGDDVLVGAAGADTFNGGTGVDLADYSARTSHVTLSIDGTANDGAPGELDNVKTDVENATGGSGNDTMLGGAPANVLVGGAGEDSLDGEAGNDSLDGGTGADELTGGAGTDTVTYAGRSASLVVTLDGLAGDGEPGEDDTINTDVEAVVGGSGDDQLTGGPAVDTLSGGPGADTLRGEAGGDTLNGDDGDDVLEGGAGSDTHAGGAGLDAADYSARTVNVTVDLDGAADDGETAENDNVRPDVERLLGGAGDDTLTGNNGANVLSGGAGLDLLDPGRGTGDLVLGGTDTDTVTYAARTAPVVADLDGVADDGEAGEADTIETDVENLVGGAANDRLTGGAGVNVLNGGSGNDVLDGGSGSDLLLGGAGTDTADYSSRSAAIAADLDGLADDGAAGEEDTVETDVEGLAGGTGNDVLTGALGTNLLSGGAGNDVIDGAQGDDDIDGGAGDDDLTGGAGADLLRSGAGADRVRARDGASDLVRCSTGTDTATLDEIDDAGTECETADVPPTDTTGPAGPQGPAGQSGATGAKGSRGTQGPAGAPGRDAVVSCKPAKGKGSARKTTVVCSVKAAASARPTTNVVVRRAGRVVTAGSGRRSVALRLARGRYDLVVTYTIGGRRTTVRQRVRVR